MKTYNSAYTEEEESYSEYRSRKVGGWKNRFNGIMIEVKDSSLKPFDKKKVLEELKKQMSQASHK